jgi:hypothetical protein
MTYCNNKIKLDKVDVMRHRRKSSESEASACATAASSEVLGKPRITCGLQANVRHFA